MDDTNPTNPMPANENSTDEFSIPVKVTKTAPKEPVGSPNLPLETVEPPMDEPMPPAEPEPMASDMGSDMSAPIPPAPMQTPTQSAPQGTMPGSGRSLQELLAEEEAKNPAPDLSTLNGHKKRNKGPVIVVVLLLLALAGGGALAYVQTNKKVQPAPTASTPATTEKTTAVKATDIDKTSSDLDASLKKIDDTKDYSVDTLSDTTLGL